MSKVVRNVVGEVEGKIDSKSQRRQSPVARQLIGAGVALLALWAAPGVQAAGSESEQAAQAAAASRPLTRAEVIADLRLWRRAHVDRYADLATSYQIDTDLYEKALAEYRSLRSGPAFKEEVAKVRAELGEGDQTPASR